MLLYKTSCYNAHAPQTFPVKHHSIIAFFTLKLTQLIEYDWNILMLVTLFYVELTE